MRYSRKSEKLHLERMLSTPFPRSGAGMSAEDGSNGVFHIQLKTTRQSIYKLNVEDVLKLERHARLHGEVPLFVVYFAAERKYVILTPFIGNDGDAQVKVVNKCIKFSPQRVLKENGRRLVLKFKGSDWGTWKAVVVGEAGISDFVVELKAKVSSQLGGDTLHEAKS